MTFMLGTANSTYRSRFELESEFAVLVSRGDIPEHPKRYLAHISTAELLQVTRKLQRFRDACGCAEGAVGFLVGSVMGARLGWHGPFHVLAAVECVSFTIAGAAFGMGIGKSAGTGLARLRLGIERARVHQWIDSKNRSD